MRWLPPFDRFWFWVGFLLGLAVGLSLRALREFALGLRDRVQAWQQRRKAQAQGRIQAFLHNAYLYLAQENHAAGLLFPLEAVLLPTRVLPLPPFPESDEAEEQDPRYSPLLLQTLPPGLVPPVLEARYAWPTLSLEEALARGASLLLIGPLGSGKTTALMALLLQAIRGEGKGPFPLYVHAADLPLFLPQTEESGEDEEPPPVWQPLQEALAHTLGWKKAGEKRALARWLEARLEQGQVRLLLDGLDELPPWKRGAVADWVRDMVRHYPKVQWVVAVGVDGYGDLIRLGFQPVRMVPWSRGQVLRLLRKWHQAWGTYVQPHLPETATPPPNPTIAAAWLAHEPDPVWPIDAVLRIWGLWAGDLEGRHRVACVHAWARRVAALEPQAWEALARAWMQGEPQVAPPVEAPAWLLLPAAGWGWRLRHPLLAAYGALHDTQTTLWQGLLQAPHPLWEVRTAALAFWSNGHPDDAARILDAWMQDAGPLFPALWEGAKVYLWADLHPGREAWVRKLGWLLAQEQYPVSVRVLAGWYLWGFLTARLAAGLPNLFRHPRPEVRHAAYLLAGLLRHPNLARPLLAVMHEPEKQPGPLRRAAFLALALIGTEEAVQGLGAILVQTQDDRVRREAAEALARSPSLGRAALEEAAQDQDFRVRKAAAYALAHIPASWARERLEALREDPEWLVQDTATRMLEAVSRPSPWIPEPPHPLQHQPWLLAYARELHRQVESSEEAWQLLARILKEGPVRVQQQALRWLALHPLRRWVPILLSRVPLPYPLGDEAWHALYQHLWAGIPLSEAVGSSEQ